MAVGQGLEHGSVKAQSPAEGAEEQSGEEGMKLRTVILIVGSFYVAGIGLMFALGLGIPAAYLTMPSWYLVAGPTLFLPESLFAVVSSEVGNLVLLMLSAALNVAAVYGLVVRLPKA